MYPNYGRDGPRFCRNQGDDSDFATAINACFDDVCTKQEGYEKDLNFQPRSQKDEVDKDTRKRQAQSPVDMWERVPDNHGTTVANEKN